VVRRFLHAGALSIPFGVLMFFAAAAVAAAPEYRGVQLHSLWTDASFADMPKELDLAAEAESNVVRLDVSWASLEWSGRGQYNAAYRSRLDEFMAQASSRGLRVIATLWTTPCWASSAPDSVKQNCSGPWWDREVQFYPPSDPRDYGAAARWMTSRYGKTLAALEVWNEPNIDFWWKTADGPAAYAELLNAAYPAAKQGNASVPVLAGSIAGPNRSYLEELYAQGIVGNYDGLAIHPYNEGRAPDDGWVAAIESLREAQQQAGDSAPLWFTEFGWPTTQVSESDQARYLMRSYQLMCNMDFVKAAVVYGLRDTGTDPYNIFENFGIVRRDLSHKPAFDALRDADGQLCAVEPEPSTTTNDAQSAPPGIRLMAVRRAMRPGSRLRLRGRLLGAASGGTNGAPVEIELRTHGRWQKLTQTAVRRDGSFRFRIRVRKGTQSNRLHARAAVPRVGHSNRVSVRLRRPRA
jgi:polysaccharide biosynthesis protein PslG